LIQKRCEKQTGFWRLLFFGMWSLVDRNWNLRNVLLLTPFHSYSPKIKAAHFSGTLITHLQWHTQDFFFLGGVNKSVEDRGPREWGSGGSSPLVWGSTQFANE
jgi:hypothetical protein